MLSDYLERNFMIYAKQTQTTLTRSSI